MPESKRLFFALNATDPIAATFAPFLKKLKIGADQREVIMKWTPLDNYHVTISFLGNTDVQLIPQLTEVLNEICTRFPPFDLKVEDIDAFANEHDARVIWLGVQNKRDLRELKTALEQELLDKNLLLSPDAREFSPHLTIGRLRNPRSVKDMISPLKRKSFGKIKVNEVVLYESKMQGAFPVYIPLAKAILSGSKSIDPGDG